MPVCEGFMQTGGCDPDGPVEQRLGCSDLVSEGASGYCQCRGGAVVGRVGCGHAPVRCDAVCRGWADKPAQPTAVAVDASGVSKQVAIGTGDASGTGADRSGTSCATDSGGTSGAGTRTGCAVVGGGAIGGGFSARIRPDIRLSARTRVGPNLGAGGRTDISTSVLPTIAPRIIILDGCRFERRRHVHSEPFNPAVEAWR